VDLVVISILPGLALIATIAHLIATAEFARSRGSQLAWGFLVIFVPILGLIMYWFGEAPRRRRGPPAATA